MATGFAWTHDWRRWILSSLTGRIQTGNGRERVTKVDGRWPLQQEAYPLQVPYRMPSWRAAANSERLERVHGFITYKVTCSSSVFRKG